MSGDECAACATCGDAAEASGRSLLRPLLRLLASRGLSCMPQIVAVWRVTNSCCVLCVVEQVAAVTTGMGNGGCKLVCCSLWVLQPRHLAVYMATHSRLGAHATCLLSHLVCVLLATCCCCSRPLRWRRTCIFTPHACMCTLCCPTRTHVHCILGHMACELDSLGLFLTCIVVGVWRMVLVSYAPFGEWCLFRFGLCSLLRVGVCCLCSCRTTACSR